MASPPEKGSDYFGQGGICQALAYGVTGARPPPLAVPRPECHDTAKAREKLDVIQEC